MGSNYNPKIVKNGLVLCLDAANPRSYSGSGTVWNDLSGNGNNGSLVNGVGFSSENKGSLVFDGVDDVITVSVSKNATCTFEFWANLTSGYNNVMLFNAGNVSAGPDLFFTGGKICWNTWDSANNPFGNIPTNAYNSFHHYVVINDSTSTTKLYFDGALLGAASYRSAATTTIFTIGKAGAGGGDSGYPWRGRIANSLIYNRALTAAEIRQNFEATRDRYGI